jgi:hypothetical protein
MLAALLLALAQDLPYETLPLDPGGKADAVLFRDLDGDGRPEILVQNGRDLHVFPNEDGRFPARPAATVRLDPAVFLWTLRPLDDPKRPSLLTQGSRALQAHAPSGRGFGPPRDLVVHPSLFEGAVADNRPPVPLDFAPDLDGDGRPELLFFQRSGIWIMAFGADGDWRCRQKLAVPVDVQTTLPFRPQLNLSEKASIPVHAFGDLSGDGKPDLGVYREESVLIFEQGKDGLFHEAEGRDLAVEKRKARRRYFQFDLPPRIADVNGDGLLDVVLVYPSKGRVHVYEGRAGRTDFTQPDQLMVVADGWSTGTYLQDLDGDRRPDLVMGVIRKIGVIEGIQIFLSGKIDLELHVYPCQADGRFSKDPVAELSFAIPFACQVTRESAMLDLVFRPNFEGDFDGDGRRDMLVHGDATSLRIHRGTTTDWLSKDATGRVPMSPPPGTLTTEPTIGDLNGDGRSDLLLRHRQLPPAPDVLELKLSTK